MGLLQDFLFTKQAAPAGNSEFANVQAAYYGGGRVGRGNLYGLQPIWGNSYNLSFTEAANRGYKAIVWVRACIEFLGKSVGRADWYVYKWGSNTPLPNHELEILMKRPNPYQDKSEFFQNFIGNLSLSGNDYIEKVVVKNRMTGKGMKVKELWHMRSDWMAPIPDKLHFIKGYALTAPGAMEPIELDAKRVMHFKYLDPLNPYVGISPISSAYRSLYSEEGAAEWNQAMLDNYASPSGILSTDGVIVDVDRQALKDEILKEHAGENRFNPMVLWGGMKWQQITLSHTDIQWLEQSVKNKEEICAVLGVPAVLIGAVSDPTYSNYGHARLSFWEDRVDPLLSWIQAKLNNELVIPYYGEEIELRYDVTNVPAYRKAMAEKVETAKVLVAMGWPLNDVNEKMSLGMEPVEWGDEAWMSSTLMPVGDATVDSLIDRTEAGPPDPAKPKLGAPDDPDAVDPNKDPGVPDSELP